MTWACRTELVQGSQRGTPRELLQASGEELSLSRTRQTTTVRGIEGGTHHNRLEGCPPIHFVGVTFERPTVFVRGANVFGTILRQSTRTDCSCRCVTHAPLLRAVCGAALGTRYSLRAEIKFSRGSLTGTVALPAKCTTFCQRKC